MGLWLRPLPQCSPTFWAMVAVQAVAGTALSVLFAARALAQRKPRCESLQPIISYAMRGPLIAPTTYTCRGRSWCPLLSVG